MKIRALVLNPVPSPISLSTRLVAVKVRFEALPVGAATARVVVRKSVKYTLLYGKLRTACDGDTAEFL
jgi:hypothetical protein